MALKYNYPRNTQYLGERLNWSHPSVNGLIRAYACNGSSRTHELISGRALTLGSNPVLCTPTYGRGLGWDGNATDRRFQEAYPSPCLGKNQFSVLAFVSHLGINDNGFIYAEKLNTHLFTLRSVTTNVGFRCDVTTSAAITIGGGGNPTANAHVVIVTLDFQVNSHTLWLDGKVKQTVTTDIDPFESTDSTITPPMILADTSGNNHYSGSLLALYVWGRILDRPEIDELTANPHAIFFQANRSLFGYFTPTNIDLVINESLSFDDGYGPLREDNLTLGESFTHSDSALLQVPIVQEFFEALSFSDAQAQEVITILEQIVNDTLTFDDSIALLTSFELLIGDTLSLSDSVTLSFSNFIAHALEDSLLFSDSVRLSLVRLMLFGDALSYTDSVQLTKSIELELGESLSFTDSINGTNPPTALTISVSDALSFSDGASTSVQDYIVSYLRRYLNDVPTPGV